MADAPVMNAPVEWDEVQRFVLRGYPKLDATRFLLFRVGDPAKARAFIGALLADDWLKFGWGKRHHTRSRAELSPVASLAFTSAGLAALDVDAETIHGFSPEFVEGLAAPARARILRDVGESAPDGWLWGGEANPVHGVLVVHAPTSEALDGALGEHRRRLREGGLTELRVPGDGECGECSKLDDRKEHFGFADGISQPRFRDEPEGVRRRSAHVRDADRLATGEILLGYENEAKLLPRSPRLSEAMRKQAPFPRADADLGRNGSYLVFRQLEQDVGEFWRTMGALGGTTLDERIHLASKIVGRWPDGTPLVKPANPSADPDDFDFARDDPDGLDCPLGAHVRRSNPRATLARDPDLGTMKSKKHRILRRGHSYGEAFCTPLEPEALVRAAEDGTGRPGPRGLHFLCFNADIANQFEFVQQTWVNGPVFAGLHGEVDPLIGDPGLTGGVFSVPGCPVRTRVGGLPRFVTVRGGAYFFAPSRAALEYLARLG